MDVFIIRDGEQIGPFDEAVVQALLAEGKASPNDFAWTSGMSAWLPLKEVLGNVSKHSITPPPAPAESGLVRMNSGTSQPPVRPTKSTAKQRALLSYLKIKFGPDTSREQAAVLISDALENPELYGRLSKWSVEKFRLHPDIFEDELEAKKQHRATHYFELCQIEGAEIIENISQAHCQVLIDSLDNRYPSWETHPKEALWDYFFPAVAEHFPQLVSSEWRPKLKLGESKAKLPGALSHAIPGTKLQDTASGPSQFQAAIRGVLYGLVVLGIILGVLYYQKSKNPSTETPAASATSIQNPENSLPDSSENTAPSSDAANTTDTTSTDSTSLTDPAASTSLDSTNDTTPMPEEVAPTEGTATTPTPAPPVAPSDIFLLKKAVKVPLKLGQVTLNPGTRLKFLAREGNMIRAKFNNDVLLIPETVADLPADIQALPQQ